MRSIVLTLAVVAGLAPAVAWAGCSPDAHATKTSPQTVQDGAGKDAVKTDPKG